MNENETPAAAEDPEVTITLRLSTWQVVARHLGLGMYAEVAPIISEMMMQADAQSAAYTQQIETEQAEVESKAATIN